MAALSLSQRKFIRSLSRKKVRNETGLFLVEGDKIVREVLRSAQGNIPFGVESLYATGEWLEENETWLEGLEWKTARGNGPPGRETMDPGIIGVSPEELRQLSLQQEPNRAIAVVHRAEYSPDPEGIRKSLTIGLENIRDPGNLGAILRTADWFGIRDVFCSGDCVELYNPKVIQSTMGSFLRVRVHYLGLGRLIGRLRNGPGGTGDETGTGYRVFATGSRGEDPREIMLPPEGMILFGNESRGLSEELSRMADRVLSIPRHDKTLLPESLNVAAAAAILCFEFRRKSGPGG